MNDARKAELREMAVDQFERISELSTPTYLDLASKEARLRQGLREALDALDAAERHQAALEADVATASIRMAAMQGRAEATERRAAEVEARCTAERLSAWSRDAYAQARRYLSIARRHRTELAFWLGMARAARRQARQLRRMAAKRLAMGRASLLSLEGQLRASLKGAA